MRKLLFNVAILTVMLVITGAIDTSDAEDIKTVEILGVHYPPYEIEEPSDGRRGYDLEVIEAAFAKVNIKTKFNFVPWNRAKKTVEAGGAAALMSCSYRSEREELYLYSDVISSATRGLYAREGYSGPVVQKLEDVRSQAFSKLNIGVVQGYAQEKELKKLEVTYDPAPNDTAGIKKLLSGRTDLFLTTKENTEYLLHEMGETKKLHFFQLLQARYYVCFGKKTPGVEKLRSEFNRGLRILFLNGEYDRIHDNYR